MGLRTVKTFLKMTNQADVEVRANVTLRDWDAMDLGIPVEQSMLTDQVKQSIWHARWCYVRMKRAYRGLTRRQQKRLICQINAKKGIRNTFDKVCHTYLKQKGEQK
jgi:hypothetical protein